MNPPLVLSPLGVTANPAKNSRGPYRASCLPGVPEVEAAMTLAFSQCVGTGDNGLENNKTAEEGSTGLRVWIPKSDKHRTRLFVVLGVPSRSSLQRPSAMLLARRTILLPACRWGMAVSTEKQHEKQWEIPAVFEMQCEAMSQP